MRYVARADLRAARQRLFVFGDNMKERGFGGQAREMRGEPNAVGIPTKWYPDNKDASFFCSSDLPACRDLIEARFLRLADHLKAGGDVVWPAAGLGTGRADLRLRAPRIWDFIEARRARLFELGQ